MLAMTPIRRSSVKGHPGIQIYDAKRALPSQARRYIPTAFYKGERRQGPTFVTIREAEAWKHEEERAMKGGQDNLSRLTLAEFIDQRWWPDITSNPKPDGSMRAAETLKSFGTSIKHVKRLLGRKQMRALQPSDVDDFKAQMRAEGMGRDAQRHAFARLRQVLVWAVERRVLAYNPAAPVDPPAASPSREPQFTPELLAQIIREADTTWYGCFIKLAMCTGLSFSEQTNLLWADVDFAERSITVTRGKTRARVASIGIGSATIAMLQQHRYEQARYFVDLGQAPPQQVFTRLDGASVTFITFRRHVWVPLRERLDVPWLHFHDLRHVTASLMAKAGIPDAVRQDRMRHATARMTRLYTQTDLSQQQEAAEAVERLLGL
jgi:integrase